MSKKSLGQFNTTRSDYILEGFEEFVHGKAWLDPYAGNCDLLNWVRRNGATSISGYDVDKSKVNSRIQHRNTLLDPPDYSGKAVIFNPPYLARNKSKDKELYDKYDLDDLYKIAIATVCDPEKGCDEGLAIVPLNFLSSVYSNTIRDKFFENYEILYCKVFEETVFDDTDYTVCAFYFVRRPSPRKTDMIDICFCPSKVEMSLKVSKKFHWIVGEEFYQYIEDVSHKGVGRWTIKNGSKGYTGKNCEQLEEKNAIRGTVFINDFVATKVKKGETDRDVINGPKDDTYFCKNALKDIILLRAIDTGTLDGRIGLSDIRTHVTDDRKYPVLLGLETSRNLAHVRFDGDRPTEHEQLAVIQRVNTRLEEFRRHYNSVFMTAFRNSTEMYSRKRVSFEVIYKMIARALKEVREENAKLLQVAVYR